jgi:hypothetical protein
VNYDLFELVFDIPVSAIEDFCYIIDAIEDFCYIIDVIEDFCYIIDVIEDFCIIDVIEDFDTLCFTIIVIMNPSIQLSE